MSTNRLPLLFLMLMTACVSVAPAQQAAAARPCSAPEHRQFDFWLGDWEVQGPAGKPAGFNRIESILGGCVLRESWQGIGGLNGTSLNLYAPDGKWHQTWVDDRGNLLELSGGLEDGKMVMRSAAGEVIHRITWSRLGPGRLRQLWESSRDGGKTWSVAFDGTYVRKA